MRPWRVLVVDDEAGMLRSVERVLGKSCAVTALRSPREAIDLAGAIQPDLAILDIQMPEMDGFRLMDELRALDAGLDVIFMTGSIHEIDAKLIEAIQKDAFYFLQKPFDRGVLLSLVERCFERRRLNQDNRDHQLRMEKELRDARTFQQSLLPPRSGRIGRVEILVEYLPCTELAGDFYDYSALSTDGVGLLVADVSGHGASAAMLTGVVKSAFHAARAEDYEPRRVVDRVAKGIRAFGPHHFITLICARRQNGTLEFVNAGHPPGLLWNPRNGLTLLESTGPIISPVLNVSWEQRTAPIASGTDRMVLFTDAIIEAEGELGAYGLERLMAEVEKGASEGGNLSHGIMQSVGNFVGERRIDDDLTLLVADL
jgi:phosphoserine phosphatase RsbU/P